MCPSRSCSTSAPFFRSGLVVLATAFSLPSLSAQSPAPADGVIVPMDHTHTDGSAATAWRMLRADLEQELRSASDPRSVLASALARLKAFSEDHAGSEEAVAALYNRGILSLRLGDPEVGECDLRRAAELNHNPRLAAYISTQLAHASIRPGGTPPTFTATTVDGMPLSMPGDWKGRVVLLDFWATWCGPCIAEMPNVQQLYRDHHAEGLEIISISLDLDKPTLIDFLAQRELPWLHVHDGEQPRDRRISAQYGVSAIPFMILVGRDGKIVGTDLRGAALAQAVSAALHRPGPES